MISLNSDTRSYTWRIEAGEREELTIPILDADGAPADLAGYTIDAQIKTEPGGVVLYAFPPEHVSIDAATVVLRIPGPVSAAWLWRSGWWRVVVTAPGPDPTDPETDRVIQGTFIVDSD